MNREYIPLAVAAALFAVGLFLIWIQFEVHR